MFVFKHIILKNFVDDEKLRAELKDLIDDDKPIDEESDGKDRDLSGDSKKRKKSDEAFEDRLEDADYDLTEENLGVKVETVSIETFLSKVKYSCN